MQELPKPKDFDVEDVNPESAEIQIVEAGEVKEWWKQNPISAEKAKARPLIAITIIAVWIAIIVATAIGSIRAGNPLILVPPAIISIPLTIILKFYFEEGKRK